MKFVKLTQTNGAGATFVNLEHVRDMWRKTDHTTTLCFQDGECLHIVHVCETPEEILNMDRYE